MAKYAKFFSLGGGTGPNGLQLPLGTVLDATLRQVQDGTGTGSPLYLSTGSVRIGTTAASAMYWDNTNNRLGIGVTPSTALTAQLSVGNTDFVVGANAGYSTYYGSSNNGLIQAKTSGTTTQLWFRSNGNPINENDNYWSKIEQVQGSAMRILSSRYGGLVLGNEGYNNAITLYNYAANQMPKVGINNSTPTALLQVGGIGSTSATTSLLVHNSAGGTALQITDDRTTTITGTQTNLSTNKVYVGALSLTSAGTGDTGQGVYSTGVDGQMVLAGSLGGFVVKSWANSTITLQNTSNPKNLFSIQQYGFSDGNTDYLTGNTLNLAPIYNFIGIRTGTIVRGIYYNPTLTSLINTTHIAFENTTGDVLFGTTSGKVGIGTSSPQYLLSNTSSSAPTGFQTHTAGTNSLYWKIAQTDRYTAVFENTNGYGDGVLIKTTTSHSSLLVLDSGNTLLDVSADQGGIYSTKITSGSRISWLFGYLEHAGGVGTNIYGNYATPYITLREYTGNVLINTTTDLGGKLSIKGSGSTSATTSLWVYNSSGNEMFRLRDDQIQVFTGNGCYFNHPTYNGSLRIENIGNFQQKITGAYGENITWGAGGNSININASQVVCSSSFYAGNLNLFGNAAYQGGTIDINNFSGNNIGTQYGLTISSHYTNNGAGGPNYGKQVRFYDNLNPNNIGMDMTFAYVNPTINYQGTSYGAVVGYDFNPTITAVTANTAIRAFQSSIGGVYVNTTSYNASAILQADSTTQGFLPPRVTTVQKNAIATPAAGLMVYDTNLARPCFYNGTTWTTL